MWVRVPLLVSDAIVILAVAFFCQRLEKTLLLALARGNSANKELRKALRRAGIPRHGRTQYCFRHTFQTKALDVLNQTEVAALMGYVKYRPEYGHREAASMFDKAETYRKALLSVV